MIKHIIRKINNNYASRMFSLNKEKYKFIGTGHSKQRYFDLYEPPDHFKVMETVYFKLLEQNITKSGFSRWDYLIDLNWRYKNIKMEFNLEELITKSIPVDDIDIMFQFEKVNNNNQNGYFTDEINTIGEKLLLNQFVTLVVTPDDNPNLINIITDLTFVCDNNKIKHFFKKN